MLETHGVTQPEPAGFPQLPASGAPHQRAAIAVNRGGDAEDWGRYCRSWGKRWGRGNYHPAILDAPEIEWGVGGAA